MTATMTTTAGPGADAPLLIDLDETTWKEHIDKVERWLGHVAMVQAEFRTLAEDTAAKFHEPHYHELLTKIAEAAREHERKVGELYRVIGRSPGRLGGFAGSAMAKAREALGGIAGSAAGAVGPWRDLHQLFLVSLGALGAFSVVEQLGYAIGVPALSSIALDVSMEQFKHHRLLQELVLELASISILYGSGDV